MAALLIVGLLLGAPAPVAADDDPDVRSGLRWLPLPLMNFGSDTGLGYGVRLEIFNYGHRARRPHEYWVGLQLFATTGGIESHRLLFDIPWIGGSDWRISGGLHYVTDFKNPWFGIGADAPYEPAYTTCGDREALKLNPDVCPDNPEFRGLYYYSYRAFHPAAQLVARRRVGGPWQLLASYRMRGAVIQTHYPEHMGQTRSSRLLDDLRAGEPIVGLRVRGDGSVAPSRIGEIQVGLAFDTRDRERTPRNGAWHDVSVRVGSPLLGSQFWYVGANLSLRGFRSLIGNGRLVAAGRLMLDVLAGDAPFYELSVVGGLTMFRGLGGFLSLRGMPRQRYVGKVKLIGNGELRWRAHSIWWRKHRLDLGAVAGIDAGQVWRHLGATDGFSSFPVSVVTGFRAELDESFVMSIDHSVELRARTRGVYFNLQHMF